MNYAVINTFNESRSSRHLGTVESVHRTIAAAEEADRLLQRRVKARNGRSSYLPTLVVRVLGRVRVGDRVERERVLDEMEAGARPLADGSY